MSERDKAIEEAKRSCEHNWMTNYLIPLCSECGFTEDGFRYFNRGVEKGFNAALDYHAKKNAEAEKRLEEAVRSLEESIVDLRGYTITRHSLSALNIFNRAERLLKQLDAVRAVYTQLVLVRRPIRVVRRKRISQRSVLARGIL
jgi:hypothetical protein